MNALSLIRVGSSVVGRLAPARTAKFAHGLFMSPRRLPAGKTEAALAAQAERFKLNVGWSALRFGPRDGPKVLCVHGWEGRASQFGAMATALAAQGFHVVSIDGPAHGESPERQAHAVAFARAALDADRELGPFHAVIGHSMGAAAVTVALSWGLRAARAVTIAGPSNIVDVIDRFTTTINLPPAVKPLLMKRIVNHVGVDPEDVTLTTLAAELELPVLLIHDTDDDEIPVSDGRALAESWPNVQYLETSGLGHRRVLYTEELIAAITAFVGPAMDPMATSAETA